MAESADLARILALPRRPQPDQDQQETMAVEMTSRLALPPGPCECAKLVPRPPDAPAGWSPCITKLLPIQGWYLYEAAQLRGALGFVKVGDGKTGIDVLLAMVVPGCKRAVLLVPPNLRTQFASDYLAWSQHFKVPNMAGATGMVYPGRPTLDLLAYSELSSPRFATYLKARQPEVVICDEAHCLKDKNSVRTDRFLRYFIELPAEQPEPVAFFHSGSITDDSPDNYGHMAALALREGSPVPLEIGPLAEWCEAVGAHGEMGPGALKSLCTGRETVRDGFRRRLLETPGIIASASSRLTVKLNVRKRELAVPKVIASALSYTRAERKRLDGEELKEIEDVIVACRQLASGFFYRWKYPRGEPVDLILKWFSRRQSWNREVRDMLDHRTDYLDSPKYLRDAAIRYYASEVPEAEKRLPRWASSTWQAWAEVENLVQPVTETIWVDDFVVRDALRYAAEAPSIVWFQHRALGLKISEVGNLPLYREGNAEPLRLQPTAAMLERREGLISIDDWKGGDIADNWIRTEDGSRSIACSIKAHGTGKNLAMFKRCLVTNPPVKGWEQLLGRLHRTRQLSDVEAQVYRHTREVRDALDDAINLSRYVFETTGKAEKLVDATVSL